MWVYRRSYIAVMMSEYAGSIIFCSFIGHLLLLHVSNKCALGLHAKGSFTVVYDPITWCSAV